MSERRNEMRGNAKDFFSFGSFWVKAASPSTETPKKGFYHFLVSGNTKNQLSNKTTKLWWKKIFLFFILLKLEKSSFN